jgi:type IV pilus assembly protein PilQ
MYKKISTYHLAIFCSFFLLWAVNAQAAEEPTGTGAYNIKSIEASLQEDSMIMVLQGDSAPAYTMYELFSPSRLVLDVADARLVETIDVATVLPDNDFATLKVSTLEDKSPKITRFEITLAESHRYHVDRVDNDLLIRLVPKSPSVISPSAAQTAAQTEKASPVKTAASLRDIVVQNLAEQTEILFQANGPIENFRQDTVTGRNGLPDSMYIDINNIDGSELVREKAVGTSLDKIRVATRGSGVRIVFDSSQQQLFSYDIKTVPQGLLVTIDESPSLKTEETAVTPSTKDKKVAKANVSDPTLDALIDSSEAALVNEVQSPAKEVTAVEEMQDSFGFSGYKTKRISVDFYKIDLHNVFRLFRQISDVNLIVDEDVKGTLTLALSDVPWDFALDIILNLKDLKKEERYNTIVISKKEFSWPERATDNLSFEADVEVIEQEALVIQQSASQPAEIMQAKELLRRAKFEEINDDLEDAAAIYEKAFKLWPNNANISNRLAVLYLMDLGINAKAVHFAKETLKIDHTNYQAALYAAIASANMDQVPEAMEYFSQSISGEPPMKEALISYAAFSEEKGQPEAALKLLERYAEVFNDTVNTMASRARLYDTMGQTQMATEQYKTLLYSGYQLVPGLKKYIRTRLTMNE